MPSGITIVNGDRVQHFYTASDQVSGGVAFSGNVDPGSSSTPFTLAAGSDGTGSVIVRSSRINRTILFQGCKTIRF